MKTITNLLLTTGIILSASCSTQKQIPKITDLNYENFQNKQNFENYNNFSFTRLNKFQESKIINPTKIKKEKVIFQKIQTNSKEILPFILKNKKNREYIFIKIKTPYGKFAEELLIYDPFGSLVKVSKINNKTLLTEESFQKVKKKNLEKEMAPPLILKIFDKNYLLKPVALFYEKELMKTEYYLIPKENSEIQRLMPFGNLWIKSEQGIYRGFNLRNISPNTQERAYKIL